MRFSELLRLCDVTAKPTADTNITAITADSRTVCPGSLFVALRGVKQDGSAFVSAATKAGAYAILSDHPLATDLPLVVVPNARHVLARAAAILAGPQPAHIAAVTGTNGKSSTAEFLRQLWELQGHKAASLGTLGLKTSVDIPAPPSLTTPDPVSLARTLAALAKAGITHVALEASSHGLIQDRLDGVALEAAGFSNLTRDHLDYHGTLEAYRAAKLRLFETLLPDTGNAAINADMDATTASELHRIAQKRGINLRTIGEAGEAVRLLETRPTPQGQIVRLALFGEELPDIAFPLPGRFQIENALLAAAMIWRNAEEAKELINLLPRLSGVPGRCERVAVLNNDAAAYVDYAHTSDALARVLTSLRPHTQGRLIVVFGAGGDRDRGKRPLMGEAASQYADLAIVTDDNPRTEDPASIRAEILAAAPNAQEIPDRRDAIAAGLKALETGDILVVAGKGHESGQIIGQTVLPFDDRTVTRDLAHMLSEEQKGLS
ncbi:UDP-N-acetylmuramoylalanyl-D-glutamate--2, 6-diaminopimelate ligase [Neokomagataea thailandica NBRC 106555]|uniref:UDP-N-acetylmuramoyl-L-alanyl-D-glutamate--2,6-diaminopimelate ligase n=2 Tax=Neokomagataea TaxID=1223423 RepID=A0A4Y6V685_9PROT|nr:MULTISPECIES: UDP-N-acetylmuramoyl-L-alanyl-D-glutamate--2,6-diaminopimelate ligase [Neokomagataea]QDH24121.1 UDP-N-acetylmuramoyl-L-alanyl-D-glutamate--2,6-diaminopimelate ligase [Neokomagataea tanensis]GBR50440.1 UDP-N-acetylmuramoylalanyl-D-glutamate--2, 6-diaminopimelate ligase [Neokomagataea thailandica NBRC 106555]